jgi:hypothetical protein
MIIALNYSDDHYKKQQRLNTKTAHLFGKVDKVYSFSPKDIDKEFYSQNENILSQKRGNGLWLWKPYFILKVLKELKDGDYLLYADSGSLYVKDVHSLIDKLGHSEQDIMLFELPLLECQWTKKSAFLMLDAYRDNIRFTNQIMATFMFIKKTPKNMEFIKKWLELCQIEVLITPTKNNENEDFMYLAHREDQSILSILAKQQGIVPFNDPSEYGTFPILNLNLNYFFIVKSISSKYRLDHIYFILPRRSKTIRYIFRQFCIRYVLSKLNLHYYGKSI